MRLDGAGLVVTGAVLAGSVLAFYSYAGFETSANLAEETKDPARSYPRALFGALIVAGVIYALVGAAASAVVPTEELAGSSARQQRTRRLSVMISSSCGSSTHRGRLCGQREAR